VIRTLALLSFAAALFVLGACSAEEKAPPPAPFALTQEAIGRYCGMNVLEHEGPKGQIILTRIPEPIWFSSARDAIAFTMLPDEPKTIGAIYVSDMAVAPSWAEPGAENWIDARTAFYVIGSTQRGGMGVQETVPFSTQQAADDFVALHGGAVVRFEDIPVDYVLGGGDVTSATPDTHQEH
jgi:copper chaperone NosL